MKKIFLLLLFCGSGVALFSQSQNAYLSKMSDTLLKQSLNRNMENSYSQWDANKVTETGFTVVADYFDRELFDSAEMAIREMSKISVNDLFFPYALCIVKTAKKEYDSAFYYANQTLLIDPFNEAALHNKAYVYWRAGRYEQALQVITELTNMNDDEPDNYYMKAEVLLASGKFKDAIAVLHTVESMDLTAQQKLTTYQKLVNAYLSGLYIDYDCARFIKHPFENAMTYVEKAIALDSTVLYNYYLRTKINSTLETDEGYQLVIDDYNKIASMDSSLQFTCNFAIANCLLYMHKSKEAIGLLNQSLDSLDEEDIKGLNLDDLSLVAIIRQMKALPLLQNEENEVYFNLLSGALSIRFSQRQLSRIFKKVNKKMPPSILTTRFNIYFAKQSKFKLHMEEYGNYLSWCELSVIFEKSDVTDAFENVDLMWNYALSLENCEHKTKDSNLVISSAYERVLAYLPENYYLKWDYAIYKIENKEAEDGLAIIQKDIEENKNIFYDVLALLAYIEIEDMDSVRCYSDAVLSCDSVNSRAKLEVVRLVVDFAYEKGDMELLHNVLYIANQLDPLTPYYYSREAFLRFMRDPDAKEIEKLMRAMKKCDMPQNEKYCEAFKGALFMLSGQTITAKKYSMVCLKNIRSLKMSRPLTPYNAKYNRKAENMNNLLTNLSWDEDQCITDMYIYFSMIMAIPGNRERIMQVKDLLSSQEELPQWIEAYQVLWLSSSLGDSVSQSQLQACLKTEPTNVVALTYSSYFYVKSGEYQKAVDAAAKAEQCSPVCANAIWFKALALYEMGKLEEAKAAIITYNHICDEYGVITQTKFINMGRKMLKELDLSIGS